MIDCYQARGVFRDCEPPIVSFSGGLHTVVVESKRDRNRALLDVKSRECQILEAILAVGQGRLDDHWSLLNSFHEVFGFDVD